MSKKIKLIIGSTRQGRVGAPVAQWLVDVAKQNDVDLEVLDLMQINLPVFDGKSPMYFGPQSEEAKAWATTIGESDAIIFVTAEYNRSIPAPLKNALDSIFAEWANKPTAIVSYGYIDGGGSATKHLTDVLSWLKMKIVQPNVAIALTQDMFAEDGSFKDVDAALADAKEPFITALKAINEA